MNRKTSRQNQTERRTLQRSTLVMILGGMLAFSIFLGITAGAMGVGSIYPQLNSIAQPIACRGQTMSHTQQISEVGSATYYAAKWFCVDDRTGERTEVNNNTIALIAGPVYGVAIFAVLLAILYLYWHSSVGPAKNGGPQLW